MSQTLEDFICEIRNCTGLSDGALDEVIAELCTAIEQHQGFMASYRQEGASLLAPALKKIAKKLDALHEAISAAPPLAREVVGLPIDDLPRRATVARQIAERAKDDAGKGRPILPGLYDEALARKACALLKPHCEDLPPDMLRRAVAAVLKAAGANYPDPKHNPDKFNAMMQPWPVSSVDEQAEAERAARRERLKDAKF